MFTIRKGQMQSFRDTIKQHFVDRMVGRLIAVCPAGASALGKDGVRGFVERHMAEAGIRGIDRNLDVERYLFLMFMIKMCWNKSEDSPWVNSILENDSLNPETMLDRLEGEALLLGVLKDAELG